MITFPTLVSAYLSRTSRHKQTLLGNETTEIVGHFEVFSSSQFIAAIDAVCTVFLEVKCLKRGRKPKEEGKARKEGKFSCI